MILPGATIGILGGGQLGRMMAMQARRMGYRIAILDPDPAGPAAQFADEVVEGSWNDAAAAVRLAKKCDVVTLETEHIPYEVLEKVEAKGTLRPASKVLRTIQDRLLQKEFLAEHDFPTAAFRAVDGEADLRRAAKELGLPLVAKTRHGGYDGKGQARIRKEAGIAAAWKSLGKPSIAEAFVAFDREVSVVLARSADGEVRHYSLAQNEHRNGILHTTQAPAPVAAKVRKAAETLADEVAAALDHVGVMAVEMFLLKDGKLLVNEIAPRVHNSGHYTFGACATSQFEQHVRAVCGLPLGDVTQFRPAVMLNVLGDAWTQGEPDWGDVLQHPEAHLHLYGKADARQGRKMAHVVVLHEDGNEALRLANHIHERLGG
jgi:5-(carboxyamino)imidazole ribonucleotide synthase